MYIYIYISLFDSREEEGVVWLEEERKKKKGLRGLLLINDYPFTPPPPLPFFSGSKRMRDFFFP